MSAARGLDRGFVGRLRLALGGSAAVHVAAFGVWAATYEPSTAVPQSVPRRTVKAIALTRAPRPVPPREPEPQPTEPTPEPEAPIEPPPEEPEAPPERPKGPPPPPAECIGCAMMPAALGVPKQARTKAAIPWGAPGGVPGGVVGGVPGGVVGGVLGGDPSAIGPASLVPAQKTEAPKPLEAVMQRAIFTPDPDPEQLSRTRTGLMDRHDGVNRTAFCIDTRGRTVSVRTAKRFGQDPQIDQICRDAVKRWRFRPFLVAGRPVRVCSVAVFELKFD